MLKKLAKFTKAVLGGALSIIGIGGLTSSCDDGETSSTTSSQYTYEQLQACGDPSNADFSECLENYKEDPCANNTCLAAYGMPMCEYYDPAEDPEGTCAKYQFDCDKDGYNECLENYKEDPCKGDECVVADYGMPSCEYYNPAEDPERNCAKYQYDCDNDGYDKCIKDNYTK